MAEIAGSTLERIAKSNDEIEIETRRNARSPAHRTTIWIVPTPHGVFVRSMNGRRGRWYQEAVAGKQVTIRAGRRKVEARAQLVRSPSTIREASEGYREKYAERWPDDTKPMLRRSVLTATLRLREVSSGHKQG